MIREKGGRGMMRRNMFGAVSTSDICLGYPWDSQMEGGGSWVETVKDGPQDS